MTAAKGSQIPAEIGAVSTTVDIEITEPSIPAAVWLEALQIYVEEAIASGSKERILKAMTRSLEFVGVLVGSLAAKLPAAPPE
jgi:hypothetical protein